MIDFACCNNDVCWEERWMYVRCLCDAWIYIAKRLVAFCMGILYGIEVCWMRDPCMLYEYQWKGLHDIKCVNTRCNKGNACKKWKLIV